MTDQFKPLRDLCEEYLKWYVSDKYCDDNDWDHYIFETALECTLGTAIWDRLKLLDTQREIMEKSERLNSIIKDLEKRKTELENKINESST